MSATCHARKYALRGPYIGVLCNEEAADQGANISALGHVMSVAERLHEPVAVLGVLVDAEAFLRAAGAEAVVDEGWGHDVERGEVAGSVDELRKDLGDFNETAWPAVEEDQRDGVLDAGLAMNEMDVQSAEVGDVDVSRELWHFVELCFGFAPVVLVLPVLGELLDIGQRSTLLISQLGAHFP